MWMCVCVFCVICVQRPKEGVRFSFHAVAIGGCELPVVNARHQIQVHLKTHFNRASLSKFCDKKFPFFSKVLKSYVLNTILFTIGILKLTFCCLCIFLYIFTWTDLLWIHHSFWYVLFKFGVWSSLPITEKCFIYIINRM